MLVKTFPKERPRRCKAYREFISGKRCSACGSCRKSDPHHYQSAGSGKMGGKVDDFRCVPLCHFHHDEYHRVGRESFQRKYPFWKPEILIERYNREWSQREAQTTNKGE